MNSVCSSYVTDDSLQELSEMSDFFLSSVTEHIKTEPADVIDEVGHVIMTSLAPVVGALSSSGIIYLHLVKSIKYKESKVLQVCLFFYSGSSCHAKLHTSCHCADVYNARCPGIA